jgi:hypothetical protein
MISKHFSCSFAGFGDFATVDGIDCDINKTSMKILYSAEVLSTSFCIILILRYLMIRSIEKKTLFYISADPKTMFPWVFLLQLWLQIAFASLKLADPADQLVGRNMIITILCESTLFLAFLGLAIYFFVILKFLKSFTDMLIEDRRDKITEHFATLRMLCPMIPPMSFIFSFIVVIGINYPEHYKIFQLINLIGDGSLTLFYGFLTTSALSFLRQELSLHLTNFPQSSDEIRLVLKRLTLAYYMLLVMSILMGVSYFIFCTDYMLRKSTYLIIWLDTSWPPAATILILTVSRISSRVKPEKIGPNASYDDDPRTKISVGNSNETHDNTCCKISLFCQSSV